MAKKRGKNLKDFEKVVRLLSKKLPLDAKYKNHKLTGNMQGFLECHLEPDYLLIYEYIENTLVLIRLGTHSDLFK